ncbi:S41 family peptidase [Adlercreutzia sp. ZJ138]|uniref:S41 family peptidase n=1 Tax=Adlercreutzia sp. ZJ138 TaxID=2709405 RepID=UPI0013EBCAF1|nr:S41 family peptidase [Adlercreutzia sp. ZJ138]
MGEVKNSKHAAASERHARIRLVRLVKVMLFALLLCTVFVMGFVVRGQSNLLESLGFPRYAADVDRNPGATVSGDTYDSIGARMEEVEGITKNYSLNTYDLDVATHKVLDAFSEATADPYFDYFDADRYAVLLQEASGITSGIGVLFSEKDGRAYAADVFEESAAQAAGVQQGDTVIAIDGERDHDWTMTEVTSRLLQAEGDPVIITWRRASAAEGDDDISYTTTLDCSSYSIKNVETRLEGTTGVITLRQLSQNSTELVANAVADLRIQGATSFVLDLRDNPGGFLTQAVNIASLFVESGTIVNISTRESDETARTATGDAITDAPLVVLVNGHTGAAAEVLAAALQDNERAILVGEKTLGKGSVQVMRALSFGGALRYTAAYYQTPLGHDIDGVGIAPNITVSPSGEDDNQMQLALETALSVSAD